MNAKTALRQDVLNRRKQAHKTRPDFAPDIIEALVNYIKPRYLTPYYLASYLASGSEIDAQKIVTHLVDDGARAALPVCLPNNALMRFRQWQMGDDLADDAMGMRAPLVQAPYIVPNVLLVPVVAFDKQGGRLGRGGGFYDRALANLREDKNILAIGVAYDAQQLDKCPMELHDQRLNAVVTPTIFFECFNETK